MSDKPRKPPRIWIATLLAWFYPGVGQSYANDRRGAWVFGGLFAGSIATLMLLRQLPPTPPLVAAFLTIGAASIACSFLSAIQSFFAARRARRANVPKGNRLVAAAIALLMALAVVAFNAEDLVTGRSWHLYSLRSSSMEPTIQLGDLSVAAQGRLNLEHLRRGDIIVTLDSPGVEYVRRLIGFPGDTIAIKAGRLWLNGKPVPVEPVGAYAGRLGMTGTMLTETLEGRSYNILDLLDDGPADTYPETGVPDGHVFLLGDNRDNANDSRFIGPVPESHITGLLRTIYWSPERGIWRLPSRVE